jgi:isopentenyl-diphosphate delta-isomerase
MDNKLEIILVDESDNPVWFWEKIDVHKRWLLHRAISVLILNWNWKMLLQQRALNKYHCGWMRSNAVCTHPLPNESSISAAHRRLQEEMWFDTDLQEMFSFSYTAHFGNWLIENEYDHVFLGYYDWEISYNTEEVNYYKWILLDELRKDIVDNPENYTEWFKIIMEKYLSFNL